VTAPQKGKYALETSVAPEKSQREIHQLLEKYKVTDFELLIGKQRVGVAFQMRQRTIRFVMPMPTPDEMTKQQFEQQGRSAWRALRLVIQGKLESVDRGVESFDEAFMGQIVIPGNETVAEWLSPQLETIFKSGKMPPMLASGG
jgi:hypothetical protein